MKRKILRISICLMYILFLSTRVNAQTISEMQDQYSMIIPPGPTASSMISLTENTLNHSTGAVSVTIPIFNIRLRDLELPINLVYKSNGIKVDQISSAVGLGWGLMSGGVITRSVRGIPDDRYEEDSNNSMHRGLFYSASYIPYLDSNNTTILSWDKGFASGYFDDEPDIFYFSLPGYSGQFFFDSSRQIHFSSKDNIKIEYSMAEYNPISSFTITTPDGNQYLMSTTETTRTNLPYDFPYTSSWYLTNATSQSGSVSFSYDDEDTEEEKVSGERKVYVNGAFQSWNKEKYPVKVRVNGKRIKTINWDRGTITFNANLYLRQDVSTNSADTHPAYAIDAIVINNGNNIVKKFDLEYGYFDNSATAPTDQKYLYRRLKLTKLSEIETSSQQKISHTFSYNTYALPNRNSKERDYWGYFNDNNATTLVPNLWFCPEGGLNNIYPSQYSIFERDNYTGEIYFSAGVNRGVNATAIKAGILENIKYPTGGELHFIYEPNDFYFDGETRTGGGIRLSEEQLLDNGIRKAKQYSYLSKARVGESSGLIASIPNFATQRTYGAGTITTLAQLERYTFFSVSNMYEDGLFGGSDVLYEDVTINETNNGRKELKFDIPQITSNSFCLKSEGTCFFDITPPTPTNAGAVFRESQNPPYAPYYYHYLGYLPVKDYISYNLLPDMNWAVGQLLEERIYTESLPNNPVKKTIYKYKLEQIESFPAHSVDFFDFSGTIFIQSWFTPGTTIPAIFNFYAINDYENISGIKKLTEKTEYNYDPENNINVETKTYYFYNSYNLLQKDSTILSNGDNLEKKYKYPFNYTWTNVSSYDNTSSVFKTMKDRNMIINPIEITTLVNSKIVGSELMLYYLKNNLVVPKEHYKLEFTTPFYMPFPGLTYTYVTSNMVIFSKSSDYKILTTFQDYDTKGNILQATPRDGITTSYLWDSSDSYLMAKVVGASYSQISSQNGKICTYNSETLYNSLNSIVPTSQITTYSYKPLIGMTSQTDLNGVTSYYGYDDFGRLKTVTDDDNNIVNQYDYHYAQ